MPNIPQLVDQSRGCDLWCMLDLKSGFYNVPIAMYARCNLGIVTQDGRFCYKRMPMGVLASPGWFQHIMFTVPAQSGVDAANAFIDDCNVRGHLQEWRECCQDTLQLL